MSRSTLITCVFSLLIFDIAARLSADVPAPQRPVLPQYRVLEGLVGTWDAQSSGGSAEDAGKPAPIGRITRRWVANHKFVQERGGQHEAFLTFEAPQNMYRAWYFHSNGHVWELTGRWMGMNDRFSVTAELDQNQSLTRNFQILNDKSHECTVTWTDENGRIGTYGTLHYTRSDPAPKEAPGNKSTTASQPQASPPPEMKILEREVGKWAIDGSLTSGEKTTKLTGSSVVQGIFGGQFVESTTTLQGREGESICIRSFDAATKSYRGWYFNPDAIPIQPSAGTWDEKEQTMTWKEQLTADIVSVSKKQWVNGDTAKIHVVCTRRDGSVYFSQDGTITRQKDK